jgi:uncharacterized protein (DUF488 family)
MGAGFATIGHSTRPLDEFLAMLRGARVELVCDIRSFPRSRTNPAFNVELLPGELETVQIGYRHLPGLGGRRPKQSGIDPSLNAFWRVQSFHNYADYALGESFAAAFEELVALGRQRKTAIMCAEAVWWRCHRRIVADYLLLAGHRVDHLMTPERTEAARPTEAAQRYGQGQVIYPAQHGAGAGS